MRHLAIALVRLYQGLLSPLFPSCCRYRPTCSEYAVEALRRYGVAGGLWRTLKRVLRCHPWGGAGEDPVV